MKIHFVKTIYIVLSLSITFLISCTRKNIKPDFQLDESKKEGVIIISLTRTGEFRDYHFEVYFQGIYHSTSGTFEMIGDNPDWEPPASLSEEIPINKPAGRLVVINIPEGEYHFYLWKGVYVVKEKIIKANTEFSKKFKVISGKALYLGNMHIHLAKEFFGGEFKMNFQDKRERDLELFHKKFPLFKPDQVIIEIIE